LIKIKLCLPPFGWVTFRKSKEDAQAITLWAATFSLGMGIGLAVGGWLLDNFHWSSVFYINMCRDCWTAIPDCLIVAFASIIQNHF